MRKNEYQSLDEFYREYCGIHAEEYETYIGLDFKYKGKQYRMCFEPNEKYCIYEVNSALNVSMPNFIILGEFNSLDDLLESKLIDNKLFKEVILDDDTIITGKD